MLKQAIRPAMGATTTKRRVIFFIDRIGITDEMRPVASGGGLDLKGFSPLDPYKSQTTVVQHMYNPFGHHLHGNLWPLTAMDRKPLEGVKTAPLGPSIDRVIAKTAGKDAPISSINLAVWPGDEDDDFSLTYSSDGPLAPFAIQQDPVAAFASIFGKTTPADPAGGNQGAAAALLRQKKSLLDFVVSDIKKASNNLASTEKAKLEQYMTSLREIEAKLKDVATAQLSCTSPKAPDPAALKGKYANPDRPQVIADIMTQAMGCGFTQVGVIAHNTGGMPFLGVWHNSEGKPNYPGQHGMWHGGATMEHHKAFHNYSAKSMAYLRGQLERISDGSGTLADSTLIVFMNNSGGQHHGGQSDYLFITVGDLKGALKTGRLVQLPTSKITSGDPRMTLVTPGDSGFKPQINKEHPVHSVSDFFVSIARAVGADVTSFGDPRINKGPLQEVYA
ncbi:MAG: DUF1552 domain-containing protein [Deltaproteobacteria bacterium]|nr:DUF1552 domain-containing protein [Deltaproteobacteria bacterium]